MVLFLFFLTATGLFEPLETELKLPRRHIFFKNKKKNQGDFSQTSVKKNCLYGGVTENKLQLHTPNRLSNTDLQYCYHCVPALHGFTIKQPDKLWAPVLEMYNGPVYYHA